LSVPGSFKALYLSSLHTDHPPLLFFLLHPVVTVTSSEFVLRLIPVLAGGLFPWVAYRWLSGIWNTAAGLTAECILALSPNLISLSAQVRGYTLELLFAALALLFLDTAIRDGSLRAMIAFDIALLLMILSEYSAVWFAAAVAIYFFLRSHQRRLPLRLVGAWAVGQLAALGLCAALFWTLIKPRFEYRHGAIEGYLTGRFPAPHQNLLVFSALGTVKQFAYTFSSPVLGIGAAVLFLICLVLLAKGRNEESRAQDRALAALLVTPFFLACVGAVLRVQPYGRSRHSVILALFVAAGVSIGVERPVRLRLPAARWGACAAAFAVASVWLFAAAPDFDNIPDYRHHKDSMAAAIRYIQSSVPPGSLVLADQETTRSLRFYWSSGQQLRRLAILDEPDGPPIGSLRVVYRRWDFGSVDDFLGDLASVRSEFGLSRNAPVWVVDGGFNAGIVAGLHDRFPGVTLPSLHDFDGAIAVFQTPPGI
jgi:hypothetical protein